MSKTIEIDLFKDGSLEQAIEEINKYADEIERKNKVLRDTIANRIAEELERNLASAITSDMAKGGSAPANDTVVSVKTVGNQSVITAEGNQILFIEFGSGVYHNGAVGSSKHPKGAELGMTIGSYGYGNGKKTTWGYYNDGELLFTHGTPTQMPFYKAVSTVINEIPEIAKEVFK